MCMSHQYSHILPCFISFVSCTDWEIHQKVDSHICVHYSEVRLFFRLEETISLISLAFICFLKEARWWLKQVLKRSLSQDDMALSCWNSICSLYNLWSRNGRKYGKNIWNLYRTPICPERCCYMTRTVGCQQPIVITIAHEEHGICHVIFIFCVIVGWWYEVITEGNCWFYTCCEWRLHY